jgi:putative cell wall-binding protein
MIDAIGRVMGWKLGLFNVDPLSQQTLVSDGLYGTNTRYPEGTAVRLQAVSMHRDVGSTACPGNYLKDYVHGTIANKARATQGSMLYSPSVNTASRAYGSSTGFTVSATTPRAQSWSLKVYGKCSTWPLRTLTGSTSGNVVSAYWDLRTDGGAFVIPGSYRLELSSPGSITWNHDVTVSATMASPSSDCVTMRLAGDTRWQTSAIVGGQVNPSGTTVVVVSSKPGHLVDGVVAAPFAHALGAPILLSDGSSLAADVVVELKRRGATKAYVIGGPIALSSAVDDQLRSLGITPVRVAGDTAYDTSAKVASAAKSLGVMSGKVFVASSASGHLVDALTAGSAGVGLKMPVLLMSRDYVPEATKQALRDLGASSAVLLGGDLAISSKGYSMLKSLVPVTRIAGSTAFDTSAMIADLAARSQPTDTITLVSRDPDALVDALSGGAFGRIMLLSARTSLSTATSKWVAAHDVSQVRVIGGPLAISQGVVDGLDETLR